MIVVSYSFYIAYVQKFDASTSASLKLTVLNPPPVVSGQWSQVVVHPSSTVTPSRQQVSHMSSPTMASTLVLQARVRLSNTPRQFVRISSLQLHVADIHLVDLLTRPPPRPDGKILIIGGGIANFTNVTATFKGIIRALTSYRTQLIAHKAKIYVRRGGPNWREGL
jgi:ATP citrate (pro-S)-lyase